MRNFFVGYVAYEKDSHVPFVSSISLQVNGMPPRVWLEKTIKEQVPHKFDRVHVISISEWNLKDYNKLNKEDTDTSMN